MLKEYKRVSQEQAVSRRLFSDEDIDLYVWYDNSNNKILGFQLVYGKKNDAMRAFTWDSANGFSHTKVDDSGWYNPSPILVRDGIFDTAHIMKQFKEISPEVDKEITDLVLEKIAEYDVSTP
jgi:hypothetical protein